MITEEQLNYLGVHEISLLRMGVKGDVGVDIQNALFTDKNKKQVMKAAAFMVSPK